MLYLGAVDGALYAIHAAWSYREKAGPGEVDKVVGRVVVTDLMLGKGARYGSFLERMVTVQLMAR
jgi:hypothetical protein